MNKVSLAALAVAGAVFAYGAYDLAHKPPPLPAVSLDEQVEPSSGVELPVVWGDLGTRMVAAGVIDPAKMHALYGRSFTSDDEKLLTGAGNGKLRITRGNAGYLLNLLWAFGLANENQILHDEMEDPRYGGGGNFASIAGWTIAEGDAVAHYGAHMLITLTPSQQTLVDKISRGIYRPCCGNSTHFPDCNHGMAMLGLLELMASQGASEQEMWRAALAANSYWFPDAYETIAAYLQQKGIAWQDANPESILGADYSSAQGFASISAQTAKPQSEQGSSCAA